MSNETDILRGFDSWEECAHYYKEQWDEAHAEIEQLIKIKDHLKSAMKTELQLMILDYAYWLEVNSEDDFKYPFDPDRSVINYMKYLDKSAGHSFDVDHKVDYFYNETGDYTLTLFDEPIGIIKKEDDAEQLKRYFHLLTLRINELQRKEK